ncbi:hypothetical protein GTP46_18750 [Duganella sp. FT135W]|uniref:Uncharacterized protein n=1 Tax=Duganella flavida TaxID=2692175 RepID=A0A6L8KB39_9BURK|nr:hypothetical protein [Duganella flavida]MYM24679.1 hypothetical protein [Duganella flavida]
MQLSDAIFLTRQMPEGAVVCARAPFVRESEAIITTLTPAYGIPDEAKLQGFTYFLEASGIDELLEMISRKQASQETKVEFVCHYASHDAYPSWFYELADF